MSTFSKWSVDVEMIKHLANKEAELRADADKVKADRHAKIAALFRSGLKVRYNDGSMVIVTKTDGDTVYAITPSEHSTRLYSYLNLLPGDNK